MQKTERKEPGTRGHAHQVGKDNHVFELARKPDEVERILVHADLVGKRRCVVGAQPRAAIGVDADAKVADTGLQVGGADNVADGGVDVVVDLGRARRGGVVLVVEGQQKDAGHEGTGRGAAGKEERWKTAVSGRALARGGGRDGSKHT